MKLHEVLPRFYDGYPIRRDIWLNHLFLTQSMKDICIECDSILSIVDLLANDWEIPE
jgi:hypothetical protein